MCIHSFVDLLCLCLELSFSLIWLIAIHLSALSFHITPSRKTCLSVLSNPGEMFDLVSMPTTHCYHDYTLLISHWFSSFGRVYFPKMVPTVSPTCTSSSSVWPWHTPPSQVEFTSVPPKSRQGLWLLWPMEYNGRGSASSRCGSEVAWQLLLPAFWKSVAL